MDILTIKSQIKSPYFNMILKIAKSSQNDLKSYFVKSSIKSLNTLPIDVNPTLQSQERRKAQRKKPKPERICLYFFVNPAAVACNAQQPNQTMLIAKCEKKKEKRSKICRKLHFFEHKTRVQARLRTMKTRLQFKVVFLLTCTYIFRCKYHTRKRSQLRGFCQIKIRVPLRVWFL
jgi:hypothetical protein